MNKQFLIRGLATLGSALLLGLVQGCGDAKKASHDGSASDLSIPQGKVQVKTPLRETDVAPRELMTRLLSAVSVDFGNGGLGCVFPDSTLRCLAPDFAGARAYRLSIASGSISKIGSSVVLYVLTAEEKLKLNGILADTVASHFIDLNPSSALKACVMDYNFGYATLMTDKEKFELGSGSSGCEFDLYKIKTQKPAGLREFLDVILSKIRS